MVKEPLLSLATAPHPRKKLFIKDLSLKVESTIWCCVKYVSLMEARDGRKYGNIVLSDSSGDMESRLWSRAQEYCREVTTGDLVEVRGKLNLYQGRRQFVIQQLAKLQRSQVNEEDFVHQAPRPPEEMYQQLLQIVDRADDYYIKSLLCAILKAPQIARRLKLWPAGKSIHHAYRSGLLEHILSCAELAELLSVRYQCNFNYVLAGCILHDLCKIDELSEGIHVEYTDEGRLLGHLVKGVELLDRFARDIQDFPDDLRLHLKHILLSHHGEYAFGSPKVPQTSEAMLVHLIDLTDSRMNAFATVKRTDSHKLDWSGYVKHLDRMIYKRALPHFTEPLPPGQAHSAAGSETLTQSLGESLQDFKPEQNSKP